MELKKVKKILDYWGKEMVSAMKEILTQNNKGDSNLYQNLNYRVVEDLDNLDLEFLMADYAHWVDKGRKPGKQPPLEVIVNWTARRGIPKKAVFPIARNIGLFGLPATNFKKGITDNKNKLLADLEKAAASDIAAYIDGRLDS